MDMNEFVSSNYIRADELDERDILEFRIADVKVQEFPDKDGTIVKKVVIRFEDGRGVVLNQTRLRVLIAAFGPNSANWINRPIRVKRGKTTFAGKPVNAVEVEPIQAAKIEPPARPKGSIKIQSGKQPAPVKAETAFYDDDPDIGWERDEEPGDSE